MRKIETKFTKRQLLLHATLVHYNVNDYYLIVGLLNELRILSQSGWNRWRQCLNSMISHLSTRCFTVFHKISFILLEDDDKNTVIRKNNWLQRRASNGIVQISHRFGVSKCKTNILNGLFNALNIDREIQLHTHGCNLINTWQNARHRNIAEAAATFKCIIQFNIISLTNFLSMALIWCLDYIFYLWFLVTKFINSFQWRLFTVCELKIDMADGRTCTSKIAANSFSLFYFRTILMAWNDWGLTRMVYRTIFRSFSSIFGHYAE